MCAVKACPTLGLSPTDYRWTMQDNLLVPLWFEGPAIPDALFASSSASATTSMSKKVNRMTQMKRPGVKVVRVTWRTVILIRMVLVN